MKIKFLGIKFTFTPNWYKNWYKRPFKLAKKIYKLLRIIFTFIKRIYVTVFYAVISVLKQLQIIPPPPYGLAICVTAKNEAPYLVEWIEFHRLVGVEKIYIYDNESNDNLKEILMPYINSGFVEYTFFPGKDKQIACYNYCVKKHKFDCEYIAVIDCDEFIVPVKYNTITEFINNLEKKLNKRPDGIGINWLMFGYGGYYHKQNGLVTEIYKKCDYNDGANKHIKTIFNPLSTFIDTPHNVIARFGGTLVNSGGEPIKGPFNTPICIDEIRINHYWTKSYEEFMAKLERGTNEGTKRDFKNPYDPKYLSVDNDCAIEKYLPLLKERIKEN